jgi:creatinine amidohydrolase
MELFDEDAGLVEREIARGTPVYLPVNPIEYHGPHLSLRNDHLVSVGLARDLHAALEPLHGGAPLLLARDLDVGVDPAPGPGSIAVPLREVSRRLKDACSQLAARGAKRVVLMTFHGSPLHATALEGGVRLLRRRGVKAFSPLNLVMRELLALDGSRYAAAFEHVTDEAQRARMIRDLPQDFHGGFFETSMALHYAPSTVRALYKELPPCPSFRPARLPSVASRIARAIGARELGRELALVGDGLGWYALRPFPGYTGCPHLATPEAGAVFARTILDAYAGAARDVLYGSARSPRPILRWLPVASLGGRVGPKVPDSAVRRFAPA